VPTKIPHRKQTQVCRPHANHRPYVDHLDSLQTDISGCRRPKAWGKPNVDRTAACICTLFHRSLPFGSDADSEFVRREKRFPARPRDSSLRKEAPVAGTTALRQPMDRYEAVSQKSGTLEH
jgi:hypothetical protein